MEDVRMRLRVRVLRASLVSALFLGCVSLVVPADTAAQNGAGAEARRLFQQGEQSYRLGHYEDAVASWLQAYELDPRPRIRYNLSQAYERLGRLAEAVEALDSFVRQTSADDPLFGEASARLSALQQRVALTGVRVVGGPAGAQIFVDDQAWGATPRPDRIPTAPGNHQISIVAPNGTRRDIAVVVPAGQVVDVQVPGGPEGDPVIVLDGGSGGSVDFGSAPASQTRSRPRVLLFAGSGVAGVGLGVLAYGIGRQVSLGGCSDPGFACLEEDRVARQRSVGLALGAVMLAGGATLIVLDVLTHGHADERADVSVDVGLASLALTVRR